jgi:hypothetical protein
MAPNASFIKLRNTGGTVEVHWDALSDASYKRVADYTSDFSPADGIVTSAIFTCQARQASPRSDEQNQ